MKTHKFNSENIGKMEDMITEIIFSNSLYDFGKGIQELIAYANKNGLSAETVLHELFQDIESQYFADLEDTQYQLLRNDSAVRMFLYTDWSACKKESGLLENSSYMEKLLSDISHNKGNPIDSDKTEKHIQKVMELIQSDIDIFAVLPNKHSVNIAFADQPETRYAGYMTGHMPTTPDRTYHQIMVSSFADIRTDGACTYAFIKAIGCVYLFSLTGSFGKMPKGFSAIQKTFAPKLNSETELFAECFAMALCINPELKEYDIQPNIPLAIKQQVYEYMIGLGKRWSPTQFHINQTQLPS